MIQFSDVQNSKDTCAFEKIKDPEQGALIIMQTDIYYYCLYKISGSRNFLRDSIQLLVRGLCS